jgi:8-oxo-dGTP pyrophosphatase MutT (NUDIX family)
MPADIRILGDRLLHAGRWVTLKEKSYRDARGREGRWTYAERTGGQTAVVIVARTALTGALIVIEQFRLPFERNVLEFPAGLVEPGEDLARTALRELEEETGYSGEVTGVGPEVSTTAGLATETVHMVYVQAEERPRSAPRPDASEAIQVRRIEPGEFAAFLDRCLREGLLLDAKLFVYLKEAAC